ncbi:hypothetical protein NGM33_28400 [Nocardiopsis dassonvillei]|uniref:hypothetical protein n=1 Tax=Nocardiopsis dassonvillei TaxID=2014 RepID=UPI0020A30DE5|nr:hypothetical protein [Nocardiopsis dassonvillei]MCP3017257.1 hypothetical protein [Nocardiopsis dassonvillei]
MTTETDAAVARRLVRSHRDEAAAEARYHATLAPVQTERLWHMDDDDLGFTHTRCGEHFGGFVSPSHAAANAVDHDKTCEVRRG